MWKKLLPIPFLLLAIAALYVGLRGRSPASQDSATAPSGEASAPASSGSAGVDAPLTTKEQADIRIRLTPEQCFEVQKQEEAMPNPSTGDPKSLRLNAACMRHGNVAWKRCTDVAHTRADIQACSRRYLFNVLSP